MENSNDDDDKTQLLHASITGVLYLFSKDKHLEEDIEAFKKKSDEKSDEIIKDIISSHEEFKGVLDKKNIYKNSVNTVCDCFSNNILSESALFDKINSLLEGYTEQDKLKFLEFIIIFAYSDNVITDRERETLAQFVSYFGFSEKELSKAITKFKPKKSKLKISLFILFICFTSFFIFIFTNETPITRERITSCSNLLEARKDSAKEFESGMAFARGVNEWKITEKLQNDLSALSDNERNVPQENFELFKAFLRTPGYPKNLFNWILGVLSVKPDPEYLPYLAVFQKGCMNYLISLTGGTNPLVDYFQGMNPRMYTQADTICNDPLALLSCGGLQSISDTDYLVNKEKIKQVLCIKSKMTLEGDMDKNEDYTITENISEQNTSSIWIYNSQKMKKMKPENLTILLTEIEWGGNKYFEVEFDNFIPKHSIGSLIIMSKGKDFKEEYLGGYNFQELYESRDSDARGKEYLAMAKFAYEKALASYETQRPQPYFPKNSSSIHLLGLVKSEEGGLFFSHLNKTSMENGIVNIKVEEGQLDFLNPGGFLIYAYDIDNKKFGVILNLRQPIFEGAYIKSGGLFMPLD